MTTNSANFGALRSPVAKESLPPSPWEKGYAMKCHLGGYPSTNSNRTKRVRKIAKSYVSVTGNIPTAKDLVLRQFESPLERDLLVILECDEAVVTYYDQPVSISYDDAKGKQHSYTPDALVVWRKDLPKLRNRRDLLIEVKKESDLAANGADYREKFAAAAKHAKRRGWTFRVLTEREIRTPYLRNWSFLKPYRRLVASMVDVELLHRTMESLGGEARVQDLLESACSRLANDPVSIDPAAETNLEAKAALLTSIWHLVATHILETSLHEPLTMHSKIWSFEHPRYKQQADFYMLLAAIPENQWGAV